MRIKQIFNYLALCCFLLIVSKANGQLVSEKFEKIKELEGIEEYLYKPNGLKMLLVQDNAAPVVTVQVVYRVGSKHEVPGNTGSTHLLEHLNFKGTPTFNKKNGNGIVQMLQGVGAQMNATTWNDRTNYYETIPSDKLELALHIEADRMRNSLLLEEDKNAEMTVVRNEFERGENNPGSLLNKEIWATAYMAHPYHHETIGWRSDIENMPIEVLRDFYNTYYWPDNATLTIIGDFTKESLFPLVDKYFGKITKAPNKMEQPYTEEPEQLGPRKITIKKPGQQAVLSVAYKIPGRMHEDLPALNVLSQLLGSGTSSVINKEFVDKGLATYGYASASNFQDVGLFTVSLGFAPNKDIEKLNAKLLTVLDSVKTEGFSQEDIGRIVTKLNTQTILGRDGSGSIAGELTEAIAGGDWTDYINGSKRLRSVTAEDVKRVANTYLVEDQSTTGYFIPQSLGANNAIKPQSSGFKVAENRGFYFRSPKQGISHSYSASEDPELFVETISAYENIQPIADGDKFVRKEVAGIDVVTAKTGAKGFITVFASMPISAYSASGKNEKIPSLTVEMLSKGTQLRDKFEFSQQLEKLGSNIRISSDKNDITISFKCLSKDADKVLKLLSEELRQPLFDAKEFELLKQQTIDGLKRGLTDPKTQGTIALTQSIYNENNPNYMKDIATSIKDIEAVTLQDIKEFHKTYFGTKGMRLVAVGDVQTSDLYSALKKNFKGWNGGSLEKVSAEKSFNRENLVEVISIPQKPSAEMFIGQYTGLEVNDEDYLPFDLGLKVLGGGFLGRLMQTVRDEQGLTYGIYSGHAGDSKTGGYWYVNASFNPSLFNKGLTASMEGIQKWYNGGITAAELSTIKANVTGNFKVGMSTTTGLASTLLSILERGLEPSYIEEYPKKIEAITLDQVNESIKKYIDIDKLVTIKAGSLDQEGNPLK